MQLSASASTAPAQGFRRLLAARYRREEHNPVAVSDLVLEISLQMVTHDHLHFVGRQPQAVAQLDHSATRLDLHGFGLAQAKVRHITAQGGKDGNFDLHTRPDFYSCT